MVTNLRGCKVWQTLLLQEQGEGKKQQFYSTSLTAKLLFAAANRIKIAGLNGYLCSVIPVTCETTTIPTKGWKTGVYACNLFVDGRLVKVEKLVFE
jgi:hypothetical protein